VKPPPFHYAAPRTVEESLALLNDGGYDEARVLAGGQSLVPLLNMRFARPALLVDLNGVEGLAGVEWRDDRVRIGAMTRQRVLETDRRFEERIPLLAEAARHIAHVAIRTRGTIGGSLAHADPAAELPAAMSALEARFAVLAADGGPRTVPASEFFLGPYTTAVSPGEVLEAVEVPVPASGTGWAFLETTRVHGAFALVGVAAVLATGADGRVARARLALCGVGGAPYVPGWLDDVAVGASPDDGLFQQVAERVKSEVDPAGDGHAGADYRRHLAGVLTRRALALAAERAR
jgi:carbon-monoxide dehydrogenase medium subunit